MIKKPRRIARERRSRFPNHKSMLSHGRVKECPLCGCTSQEPNVVFKNQPISNTYKNIDPYIEKKVIEALSGGAAKIHFILRAVYPNREDWPLSKSAARRVQTTMAAMRKQGVIGLTPGSNNWFLR